MDFIKLQLRLTWVIASIVSSVAAGQSTLTGTIKDNDSRLPVPGVIVKIDGAFSAAVTDKNGMFRFDNLPGDQVTLRTSHLSFQEHVQTVGLPGNSIDIALIPRTYLSEEVNITALRATDRSAVAYTDVSKEEIEKTNLGQDLPMLLQLQPSVTVTSDAGNGVGYTGIRIRGSDATRVNVTINGIPVNDAESHQVYWVDLPDVAASAEEIQIQRGVGTSVNGPGALGGSLNLQTSSMRPEAFAEASSSYGSFNTSRNSLKFGTGLLKDRFEIDGRLSRIASDGYIDRASSDLRSMFLSGGYYGKSQSLRFVYMSGREKTYQAWFGVPEDSLSTNRTYNMAGQYTDRDGNVRYYDNQTDNYGQSYYQLFYSREFNNRWLLNTALFYTKGKGYYEEYIQEPMIDPGGLDTVMTDSIYVQPSHIRQRWLDNDFMGMTWSLKRQFEAVDLMAGGSISSYQGDHFGKIIWQNYNILQYEPFEYYDDKAEKQDQNVFLKANWNFTDKWFLMGDIQFRRVHYSFSGKDITGNPLPSDVSLAFFNPKTGITYVPNTWHRFHLFAGIGQKEPVRDDYLASTVNSRPEPELLIDYEAGYRYNGHRTACGINLYFMDYARQLVLNGSINDVGEYVRESIGNSYRAGIELDAVWAPVVKWQLQGNVTLSRNRIRNYDDYVYDEASGSTIVVNLPNTAIAYSPEIIGSAIITWRPVKSFSVALTGKYVGEQYLDNTENEAKSLDAYFVNDLRLEWSPAIQSLKTLTFRGTIYNLTDRMYSANGYTYYGNYYFPQAGINFMGGVTVGF